MGVITRTGFRNGGLGVTSEEALVGARVRVCEDHRSAHWRGEEGTVRARWGDPQYVALDVLLDDGILQLFWHHELRHAGDGDRNGNGSAP